MRKLFIRVLSFLRGNKGLFQEIFFLFCHYKYFTSIYALDSNSHIPFISVSVVLLRPSPQPPRHADVILEWPLTLYKCTFIYKYRSFKLYFVRLSESKTYDLTRYTITLLFSNIP